MKLPEDFGFRILEVSGFVRWIRCGMKTRGEEENSSPRSAERKSQGTDDAAYIKYNLERLLV